MSALGPSAAGSPGGSQPPPLPPLAASAQPPHRARRWVALTVAVLVQAAAAAIAVVQLEGADSGAPRTPEDTSALGWPDGVAPLADFVEEERGLDFERSVPIVFLSPDRFRAKVTSERSELTRRDRREIRQVTGVLRAVGLLAADVDLFEASNDLSGAGVVGYYSDKDKRIRVRGTRLTPAVEVTLVHELTHALQDQHFDIGARARQLRKGDQSERHSAFHALVEGDASRIENAYRAELSADEQEALATEEASQLGEYRKSTRHVPEILATIRSAPYALGEALLSLAVTLDGNEAVDRLFRRPPSTDEHLLDPWTLVADHDRAAKVPDPGLEPGERRFDAGSFGALMWYLLLAERLDDVQALDAADGWAGDAYLGFQRAGETCVRVRWRAETARDRGEMLVALRAWVAAEPAAPASVTGARQDLVLEACDPGAATDISPGGSNKALQLALARTYLGAGFLDAYGDEEVARCVGDRLVHRLTLKEILSGEAADGEDLQDRIAAIAARCR